MRISDWSSDVCSSDLPLERYELIEEGVEAQPVAAVQQFECIMADGAVFEFLHDVPAPHIGRVRIRVLHDRVHGAVEPAFGDGWRQGLEAFAIGYQER